MNSTEYGVSLNLDLTKFNEGIQKVKKALSTIGAKNNSVKIQIDNNEVKNQAKKVKEKIQDEIKKVKISYGDDTNEIKFTSNAYEIKDNLEELQKVKDRLESGKIKITGFETDEDWAEMDRQYEEWRQSQSAPIKLNVDTTQAVANIEQAKEVTYTLRDRIDAISDNIKGVLYPAFEGIKQKLQSTSNAISNGFSNIVNGANKFGASVRDIYGKLSKLNILGKKTGNNIGNSFSRGVKNLKRFALSLFGIQTAYRVVSRAISSYLSYDQELQKNLQSVWTGLGSFFAPILEYLVGLLQKFLAYLNAVVKIFTGIDFIARANAKSLNKVASSASSASKALAGFDELQNLQQNNGGGGAETPQISLPDVDTSSIEDWMNHLKDLILKGDWFEIGAELGKKLNDALEKINWEKIQKKAKSIGENIGKFINGGISTLKPKTVGKTIAGPINTGIAFVKGFVDTTKFDELGTWIGESLAYAIAEINWGDFIQLLADTIGKLASFLANLLDNSDGKWDKAQEAIVKGLCEIKPETLMKGLTELALTLVTTAAKVMFLIPVWKKIFEGLFPEIMKSGEDLVNGVLEGIENKAKELPNGIKKWFYETIIKAFRNLFEIHSPSKVMSRLGEDLVNGLVEGIKTLWDKTKIHFDNFKTKIYDKLNTIKINAKTKAQEIGTAIKNGLSEKLNGIVDIFRNPLNGIINLINQMINKINGIKFKISGDVSNVLSKFGINVSKGEHKLFNIPTIPQLKVGTNNVYADGLAYLHAGEKVVPADVAKGGYSEENNEETNNLLRQVIEAINELEFNPYIAVEDIGRASVNYINKKKRITGEAIV